MNSATSTAAGDADAAGAATELAGHCGGAAAETRARTDGVNAAGVLHHRRASACESRWAAEADVSTDTNATVESRQRRSSSKADVGGHCEATAVETAGT